MTIPDVQKTFFELLDKSTLTDIEIARTTERPKVSHQTLSESRHGRSSMNGRTFQSVLRAVEKLSPGWVKKFHYELFLRSPGGSDPQNEVDEAIAFLKTANLSKDQMKRFLDVCCSKTLQYYPPLPLEKEEECCSTKTES